MTQPTRRRIPVPVIAVVLILLLICALLYPAWQRFNTVFWNRDSDLPEIEKLVCISFPKNARLIGSSLDHGHDGFDLAAAVEIDRNDVNTFLKKLQVEKTGITPDDMSGIEESWRPIKRITKYRGVQLSRPKQRSEYYARVLVGMNNTSHAIVFIQWAGTIECLTIEKYR